MDIKPTMYIKPIKVHYSKQLVAFIDILGFSELVKKQQNSKMLYDLVNSIRRLILQREEKCNHDPLNTRISFISDSIVLSADMYCDTLGNVPHGLVHRMLYFIRFAGSIGLELLAIGLTCRGAIVYGDIFHHRELNFSTAVGPALVKANELEKKIAIYPRILVDRSLICTWEKHVISEFPDVQESWRNIVKRDQDGEWFINIFHKYFVSAVVLIREYQKDYDPLKRADDSIKEGCKIRDRHVRGKYVWLKALRERAGE